MSGLPKFIKSALKPEDYPPHKGLEFAFLGASNSGKSTLINTLMGKNLCKTSSKPGHTSLINFFSVKKGLHFVDLPGYGFAKKSQKEQLKWRRAIEAYLINRDNLALCYVLFDLKRGLLESDYTLLDWLSHEGIPFALVATKIDKLNQKDQSHQLKKVKEVSRLIDVFLTSSEKKKGVDLLWKHIDGLLDLSASQE